MAKRRISQSVLTACAVWSTSAWTGTDADTLLGTWRLNDQLTSELQVDTPANSSGGFGGVRPSISVGGIPIPTGSSQGERSSASAPAPKILRCAELRIEEVGNDVLLTFDAADTERLTPGNVQGTRTRWSRKELTSSYETTSRKVSKKLGLRRDGRMDVTVKLNPKQGRTTTHKRVFDRIR